MISKSGDSILFNSEKYIEDKKMRERIGSFLDVDIEFRKFIFDIKKIPDIIINNCYSDEDQRTKLFEDDDFSQKITREFSVGFVKNLDFLFLPNLNREFFENCFHRNLNSIIQKKEEGYIIFSPKKCKNLIFLLSNFQVTKGFLQRSFSAKNEFKKIGKNTIVDLFKNVLSSFPEQILNNNNKTEKFFDIFSFLMEKRKDLNFFTVIDLKKNEKYVFMKLFCSLPRGNYVTNIIDVENLLLRIEENDLISQNEKKPLEFNFCYLREWEKIPRETFHRNNIEFKIRRINFDQLLKDFNYYKFQRYYNVRGYLIPYNYENFTKFHFNIGSFELENILEITGSFYHRLSLLLQKQLNFDTEYIQIQPHQERKNNVDKNNVDVVKIKFEEYTTKNRLGHVEIMFGKLRSDQDLKFINDPKNKIDYRRSRYYIHHDDIIRGYNGDGPYYFNFDLLVSPGEKPEIKLSSSRIECEFISCHSEKIINFHEFLEEMRKNHGEKHFTVYVLKYAK